MDPNSKLVPPALAAAGVYALTGVFGIAHPQDDVFVKTIDYVHEWAFVVALMISAGVLATFARGGSGVGAWLAAAGHMLLAPAAAATAIQGHETLDGVFVVGLLAIMAGYATLLVKDVRKRLEPSGLGLVLGLGWIACIPVDAMTGGGGLVLGAAWAGVAHVASARRSAVVGRSVPA